jgi:hypothetical protein
MKIRFVVFCTTLLWFAPAARSFEVVNERLSYADNKYLSLRSDLGFTGFAQTKGVDAKAGFGLRVGAGHTLNQFMEAEFIYQLSTFRLLSPDPIDPSVRLSTRAGMNQEVIRLNFMVPRLLLQPFVTVGFGAYDLFDVNRETVLNFPSRMQVPLGAGVRAYTHRNNISFNLEFNYQLLFGEDQKPDALALLGLREVSFNTYSFMAGFLFHFF